jgi:hypothetical protein
MGIIVFNLSIEIPELIKHAVANIEKKVTATLLQCSLSRH